MPRARVALKRQLLTIRRGSWQDCGPRQILRLRLSPRILPGFRTHAILIRFLRVSRMLIFRKFGNFPRNTCRTKHDTVLYMFSGPDFLYATSFFPTASTYVLAGLEPVGRIPELANLSPFVINGELRNLESSLGSLFNYSFFITQHMKSQLREGPIFGTLADPLCFSGANRKDCPRTQFRQSRRAGKPPSRGSGSKLNPRRCSRCEDCLFRRRPTQTDAILF